MRWVREKAGEAFCTVELPKVVGKARPRFDGRNHRTYTANQTARAEAVVRAEWRRQVGDAWKDFDGPLSVNVTAEQPLSRTNPKYWAGRSFKGKPDADNVCKLILDALKGVAWRDDSQITQLEVWKLPRTQHGGHATIRLHVQYFTETYMKG